MVLINHLISKKNQELQIQSLFKVSEEILSRINQSCTLPRPNIGDIMRQVCPMVIHWLSGSKQGFVMLQEFTPLKSKELWKEVPSMENSGNITILTGLASSEEVEFTELPED